MSAASWDVPNARPAVIDVQDVASAAALCYVVERSGRLLDVHADDGTWRVSDRLDRPRPVDVLVCGPSAIDAQAAVAAFETGAIRAVVCRNEPERVVAALAGLDAGLSLVPSDVLQRARSVPALTDRQTTVLRAVMAGQSNSEIARVLQLRPVTIKREVASLFAAFAACRRFELMSRGFELGYRPEPARP